MFKKIIYLSFFLISAYKGNSQVATNNNIKITNLSINEKADKLYINWATDGAVATNYFEVQRSYDRKTFTTIALVLGPDPRQQGDSYQYMEKVKEKTQKTAWYRLRHVDTNGGQQLTGIVQAEK